MLNFAANLSLLFNEVELSKRFGLAKQYGFDAVEIQFPYSLDAQKLRDILADNGQRLILFNVDADDLLQGGEGLASHPQKRDQFRRAVDQAADYAQILQPNAINVLPGCCHDKNQKQRYLDTFIDNLAFANSVFSSLGVKTVFEAINTHDMPGFLINSGIQMLNVLERIKHGNVAMQYDIYHMQRMGEFSTQFIHDHVNKIGHIQFADCPGRGQPGTGQLNFKQIFHAIAESNYSGWIGAEYRPQGPSTESLAWLSEFKESSNTYPFMARQARHERQS
jgi:hydroxypyruvate isomerase